MSFYCCESVCKSEHVFSCLLWIPKLSVFCRVLCIQCTTLFTLFRCGLVQFFTGWTSWEKIWWQRKYCHNNFCFFNCKIFNFRYEPYFVDLKKMKLHWYWRFIFNSRSFSIKIVWSFLFIGILVYFSVLIDLWMFGFCAL